jgi:hypothetical protein
VIQQCDVMQQCLVYCSSVIQQCDVMQQCDASVQRSNLTGLHLELFQCCLRQRLPLLDTAEVAELHGH